MYVYLSCSGCNFWRSWHRNFTCGTQLPIFRLSIVKFEYRGHGVKFKVICSDLSRCLGHVTHPYNWSVTSACCRPMCSWICALIDFCSDHFALTAFSSDHHRWPRIYMTRPRSVRSDPDWLDLPSDLLTWLMAYLTLKTLIWHEAQWSRLQPVTSRPLSAYVSIWSRNGTPFSPPCLRAVNSVLIQWTRMNTDGSRRASHTHCNLFTCSESIFTSSNPYDNGISADSLQIAWRRLI